MSFPVLINLIPAVIWTSAFGFLTWIVIRALRQGSTQRTVAKLVVGGALLVLGLFSLAATICGSVVMYRLLTPAVRH